MQYLMEKIDEPGMYWGIDGWVKGIEKANWYSHMDFPLKEGGRWKCMSRDD